VRANDGQTQRQDRACFSAAAKIYLLQPPSAHDAAAGRPVDRCTV